MNPNKTIQNGQLYFMQDDGKYEKIGSVSDVDLPVCNEDKQYMQNLVTTFSNVDSTDTIDLSNEEMAYCLNDMAVTFTAAIDISHMNKYQLRMLLTPHICINNWRKMHGLPMSRRRHG